MADSETGEVAIYRGVQDRRQRLWQYFVTVVYKMENNLNLTAFANLATERVVNHAMPPTHECRVEPDMVFLYCSRTLRP